MSDKEMTMVERVAAALLDCDPSAGATYEMAARAALKAVRMANGQMTAAGIQRMVAWEFMDYGDGDGYPCVKEQAIFTAMIDAALEEKP